MTHTVMAYVEILEKERNININSLPCEAHVENTNVGMSVCAVGISVLWERHGK